jgi:hypothetical protein
VQDERLVALDLGELGQVGHLGLHVDEGVSRVVERPKRPIDVQVDRRRLHAPGIERIDLDAPELDLLEDAPIGQDHGGGEGTTGVPPDRPW